MIDEFAEVEALMREMDAYLSLAAWATNALARTLRDSQVKISV